MPDYGAAAQQPAIPVPTNNNLLEVSERVKEVVEIWQGARGDGLDRVLTVRDLLNAGVIDTEAAALVYTAGGSPIPPGVPPLPLDFAIPPTPEDLVATGAVGIIILDWDFPPEYTRLSHFELWRADVDALGSAVLIAQPFANLYSDDVGMDATFYYWVRAVSDAGVSPFNAVAGTLGQTPPAFEDLPGGSNNGEAFPAGTYLKDLRIKNGAITTAKIGNAAIVEAKIGDAEITTAKIRDANITTAKILDAAITTAKILDANITTAKIADLAVTTAKIDNLAVTTAKIVDANITTAKIADANITTAKIVDANITTAKIADANITTVKIADASITTAKIVDANITTAKINNLAVTTAKIADLAVDTLQIAGNAVTIPVSATASASINLLAGGEPTLVTLPTFTSKGGQVVLMFGCAMVTDDFLTATIRFKRNGTTIFSVDVTSQAASVSLLPVVDTPGAGVSTTYTVTWQTTSSGSATAATITTRTGYALETVK
jgi:uncharacterized protein YjbI with pentapeptide repeats